MSDQMEVDYRADSQTERLCKDAMHAIDAVLANGSRIGSRDELKLAQARGALSEIAAQIVRSWD